MGLTPCYQRITWPTRPLHLEQPLTGKTRVPELRQLLRSVDTSQVCRSRELNPGHRRDRQARYHHTTEFPNN